MACRGAGPSRTLISGNRLPLSTGPGDFVEELRPGPVPRPGDPGPGVQATAGIEAVGSRRT